MDEAVKAALADRLLAMADDELLLAHRNSEWTGHAPILEEDIAIANIAQDELGHATIWYGLLEQLTGQSPDELAFFREPAAFRNTQFTALPRGDWAFTLLRQYLFDVYETLLLQQLVDSTYQPMADAAAKISREEMYHVRHSAAWVRRLGLGTDESQRRMQAALDTQWTHALQLFVPLPHDQLLADANISPLVTELRSEWEGIVRSYLAESGLAVPDENRPVATSRTEQTHHLTTLLTEMQEVARLDAEADW